MTTPNFNRPINKGYSEVTGYYQVITAFAGASVGNILEKVVVVDLSSTSTTQSQAKVVAVYYINLTTGLELDVADVDPAKINYMSGGGGGGGGGAVTNDGTFATPARQDTANTSLASLLANQTNGTQRVIVDSLPATGGSATSANQVTGNNSLASIDSKISSLGQKTMASSTPIVIASDQSPVLMTKDATNYVFSNGNSSSAQLAAAATFNGVIESALSYPQAIISIVSNQNITITVRQYNDLAGTKALPTIVYTRTANSGFNQPVSLSGDYYSISVQNTGGAATTNLSINTYLGSLEPTPNLTNAGSQPVEITGGNINGQNANFTTSLSTNPVRIGARARSSTWSGSAGDDQAVDLISAPDGRLIVLPFSIPNASWSYAAATGGISNTTTAVTIKTALTSYRNYITSLQIYSDPLGTATELAIRDGAGGTVLWRLKIGTAGIPNGLSISFDNPLRATTSNLLEVVTLTANGTGSIYVNAQGFVSIT